MATVNVLKEILDWSVDRPPWQRDALRRLVVQGELKESGITELAELCKASHGLAGKKDAEPIGPSHLPHPGVATKRVSVTSLTHHSGVNALAQDQTVEFGPSLTVVYGANAAGKSGYTRILKRACRARGAEDILGNVVSESAPGRPSATVKFTVDGTAHDLSWDDDKPADRFLSRVSVFDRHCASVYVAEQTDVAFRPHGLDLFDKLSRACEAIRRVLERERKELEAAALHVPEVTDGTKVHELLSHLTSLTNPEDVKQLASLSDSENVLTEDLRKRLRDLHSDDPQRTARGLQIRAKRVEGLAGKVRTVTQILSKATVAECFSARDRMNQARTAAEEIRFATFEKQPLPNTGSEAWRVLWAAAERFSTTDAYANDTFPVTEANARCVLCQQQLKDDGIERLRGFHDFLNSEVQRERDEASGQYERLRTQLSELLLADEATNEALDELQLEDSGLADAARGCLEAAQHRRVTVMNALTDDSSSSSDLPEFSAEPEALRRHAETLRARATELLGANRSALTGQVETQLRELEGRKVLAQHREAVLAEIERKKRLAAYQLCLDETKTTAITRKSSEVTKLAVTEQLAKSFKQELQALRFQHVEVEMVAAGGSRGALYHKLQLRRAPGVSVPKVVSDGEARCLSIASFFAELSTAAHRSAILFDDPVSSLDQNWRDNVATRLVAESKSRQVIVFTHDIVFLVALTEHAKTASVDVKHQNLRRGSTVAGLSEQGPPYRGMKVSARVGFLKSLLHLAAKLHKENEPREYEHAATRIYALLRQAWERGVEELLLYGVVMRYRSSVDTKKARFLEDITVDDCTGLNAGMTKSSKWEGGHDHAAAEGAPFPLPDEIEKDITALEDWVKGLRKRRP